VLPTCSFNLDFGLLQTAYATFYCSLKSHPPFSAVALSTLLFAIVLMLLTASEEDSTMVLYDHDKAKREEDADMVLYDHDKAKREEDTVMVLYDHDKAKREEDADMVLYDHDKREEGAFNADFADK